MRIKTVIILALIVGVLFSFIYGSKHKVVNLKTLGDHFDAYHNNFGRYPETLVLSNENQQRYGENSYIVQLFKMVELIETNGYTISYHTNGERTNYTLQMKKAEFCKQISSADDKVITCRP